MAISHLEAIASRCLENGCFLKGAYALPKDELVPLSEQKAARKGILGAGRRAALYRLRLDLVPVGQLWFWPFTSGVSGVAETQVSRPIAGCWA